MSWLASVHQVLGRIRGWARPLQTAALLRGAVAAPCALFVTQATAVDAAVPRSAHLSVKKVLEEAASAESGPPPVTLFQTHTGDRLVLSANEPTQARFVALLADRVTGESKELDPRLLGLLREVAKKHPGARIELVSGYRSAKLNEAMRKKGRHVASHSQHSLGQAVDFRVVSAGDDTRIDPRALEGELRALGWQGGVGVYPSKADGFVHADVGARRRWGG